MEGSFQLAEVSGPVAVVTFDTPGKKVNTLSQAIREEFGRLLEQLERRTDFLGLLFRSGKPGQFVAGADLRELAALANEPPEQSVKLIEDGHLILNRLGGLPYPVIALVDGPAFGGGTELALACDYRIVSSAAKFGLPETKLGMIPAWGGTQRLPRVVGVTRSVQMICGGEPITAELALESGLADAAAPAEALVDFAIQFVAEVRKGGAWQTQRLTRREPVAASSEELNRELVPFHQDVAGKSDPRSVAQAAALEALGEGLPLTLEAGLLVERRVAAKVIGSKGAATMIDEFFRSRTPPTR